MPTSCPICSSTISKKEYLVNIDSTRYLCPRCGDFAITDSATVTYQNIIKVNSDKIATTSYEIRKMQRDGETPLIKYDLLKILLKKELPNPQEQVNNLIMWLGDNLYVIGKLVNLKPYKNHLSIIGASSIESFEMIITHLINEKLLHGFGVTHSTHNVSLSIPGWAYFEELKQETIDSRQAFMAMKFGNPILDRMVEDHFKPAVQDTGFSLITLDDTPVAGLIDDRMRVEIRKSRFMIADLTHQNNGAYWESGFAEGLGRPVIYTCEKSVWGKEKSHFDTNHLLTVIWDEENPTEAVDKLKAAIRATLPDEAKLNDN